MQSYAYVLGIEPKKEITHKAGSLAQEGTISGM